MAMPSLFGRHPTSFSHKIVAERQRIRPRRDGDPTATAEPSISLLTDMIGEYIGNYRLTRLLGEGGMGMVYQAVHDGVGGQAAIKILRPEVAQKKDATTRLFNEARAANSIPHPGIVRIFDCGYTSQGVAYLAMEYLAGESLRARIDRERSLSVADALRIARQIASVLQASHAHQVVHRDLKPDNIMLVPDPELPGGERVKLLDFGVAKLAETLNAEPMLTRSDMLMGTPTYMAPEQCRGAKHVTDRSDVYSLGVILYQMLAGVPPFTGDTVGELIAMHLADSEPALADVAPHVDPEICSLVHAMLRKKPLERPSVEEVAQELKRMLISISTAEGMSPLQARRMASETAIPILPPLSAEAQAVLRGNTAPPTLSGGDSGPHRTPEPRPASASGSQAVPEPKQDASAAAAGTSASAMGRVPAGPIVVRRGLLSKRDDPALSSTWDGEAISRLLPPGFESAPEGAVHPLAVTDPRIEIPSVDPEATPPLASVQPAKQLSTDTPKRGELAPASGLSAAAATQTHAQPATDKSRLPWLFGGLLLLVIVAGVASLWRPQPSLPGTISPPDMVAAAQIPKPTEPPVRVETPPPVPEKLPGQTSTTAAVPDASTGTLAVEDTASGPDAGKSKVGADEDNGSKTGSAKDGKNDLKKAVLATDAGQNAALAALRGKQFADAQRLSQGCVDKQPTNYRCWWMLGVAACQQADKNVPSLARTRLMALGRASLAKEVDKACGTKTGTTADVSLGSLRLRDDKDDWLNIASGLFESGRYLQAQVLAEKNLGQSPVDAWSMIGRSACALGQEEKANQALAKVNDKTARSDIVYYCVGKGFAYSIASGKLSKR